MQAWDSCNEKIDFEALRGRSCVVGIDLADSIDLASMCLLFPPDDIPLQAADPAIPTEEANREGILTYSQIDLENLIDDFIVLPYFWMPKATIQMAERRDHVPYRDWVRDGYIEATEGNVIDYAAIKQKLVALKDIYQIRTIWADNKLHHLIGYDPHHGHDFMTDLQNRFGITMIQVLGGKKLSEPIKQLARAVLAKKLRHGGNPTLRWNVDNLVVTADGDGCLSIGKDKKRNKIDGINAAIIAFAVALRNTQPSTENYYATHELRVL